MSYQITKVSKNIFNVVEVNTGQLISFGLNYQDCCKIIRKLKSSQGFQGWTPAFFLASGDISEILIR